MRTFMELPKDSGIYLMRVPQCPQLVYVGQSKKSLLNRQRVHERDLRNGRDSRFLQAAYNLHKTMEYQLLLLCSSERCDYWENFFIAAFRSWDRNFGYNIRKMASGSGFIATRALLSERGLTGHHWSKLPGREAVIEKISKNHVKPVWLQSQTSRGPISEATRAKLREKAQISEAALESARGSRYLNNPDTQEIRRVKEPLYSVMLEEGWLPRMGKKRVLSPETREKMSQAQRKRRATLTNLIVAEVDNNGRPL